MTNIAADPTPLQSRVSGYIRTLDGWRALAVLSVIAYHDRLHRLGWFSDKWVHSQGLLGVDLFFAISGLLICSRLLDEEAKTGRISLKNFYVRRTLRILPAMLAYLAAVAVLGWAHVIHVSRGAWLASLFFVNNYYTAHIHNVDWSLYTNHFWSLAVEEHFYLLLPSLLVFAPNKRIKLLSLLSALGLIWNIGYTVVERHSPFLDYAATRTDLRIYELLIPALLAVSLRRSNIQQVCVKYCRPAIIFPLMIAAAIAHPPLTTRVIVPFGFPLLILSTVLHPYTIVGRVLEWAPLRAIGRISYSIYLWQQLFFAGDHPHALGLLGRLQVGPWNLISTLTLAAASYWLLEKPLMRLGHRLAPPATPGHQDLKPSRMPPS